MTVAAAVEASEADREREDEVERTRLTMMRRCAPSTPAAVRSFLLTYFGQDYCGPCGRSPTTDLGHRRGCAR